MSLNSVDPDLGDARVDPVRHTSNTSEANKRLAEGKRDFSRVFGLLVPFGELVITDKSASQPRRGALFVATDSLTGQAP